MLATRLASRFTLNPRNHPSHYAQSHIHHSRRRVHRSRSEGLSFIQLPTMSDYDDPFREARAKCPIHVGTFQGEKVPMILRLKDIRLAAKDTTTYSSDAPRRVPIPSEEDVRTVRQYPLEVDPPVHAEYRKIVEPFFLRPRQAEVLEKIHALLDSLVSKALEADSIDVVKDFAIPLQSYALTYLLNVPEKKRSYG